MDLQSSVFIPSLEAKDVFLAGFSGGYRLFGEDGSPRLSKFINTLDYSLELLKLSEIYGKVFRRKDFLFCQEGKSYTRHVINMTFSYSVKTFNRQPDGTYVRFPENSPSLEALEDQALLRDGSLMAIRTEKPVSHPLPQELLGREFYYENGAYHAKLPFQTVASSASLRESLYEKGFFCDGIHYVRYKRSAGGARVGKCLFINEALEPRMRKWSLCGLSIPKDKPIDLAALEAYQALTLSSMIGTVTIRPEQILVIPDGESCFYDHAAVTSIEEGRLVTKEADVPVANSIWDGQSLIDKSLMGQYSAYGMVLLRNRFFKSCCFQADLQAWFQDHKITEISQLRGQTLAQSVGDIRLITTPSSIKYLKFGTLKQWLSRLEPAFGVVKHEKPTPYFQGRLVQTHYQLLNTLQLNYSQVQSFLKETLDYGLLIRTEPAAFRYALHMPQEEEDLEEKGSLLSPNEIIYTLLGLNDRFSRTRLYQSFLDRFLKALYDTAKEGHILVNGNYSTLLGNPLEMLKAAIGAWDGSSTSIPAGTIHSRRFPWGTQILGCRSPHVCMGNLWLAENRANEEIDRYFHLTDEIVCINSIGENLLQRLSGADFDSDTVLLTDHPLLVQAAEKHYDTFLVPTSQVRAEKVLRASYAKELSQLDIKTSVNKIGEIVNLSQMLNSLYWDRIAAGESHEENRQLYLDICQLDVMSGIEIDKAKKEFSIDMGQELKRLKEIYLRKDQRGRKIQPDFFSHLAREKGLYDARRICYEKHRTTMDYVQTAIRSYRIRTCRKREALPFSSLLKKEGYCASYVKKEQISRILSDFTELQKNLKNIWGRDYLEKKVRYCLAAEEKERISRTLSGMRLSYSTMYRLLTLLEEPKYASLSHLLFSILFGTPNQDFFQCLEESREPLPVLEEDEQGPISIYQFHFVKTYKNQ